MIGEMIEDGEGGMIERRLYQSGICGGYGVWEYVSGWGWMFWDLDKGLKVL